MSAPTPAAPGPLGEGSGGSNINADDDISAAADAGADINAKIHDGLKIAQYELIRAIGRGGMSLVYLARDTKLGRRVAVKFMKTREQRLTREARATARCDHPNIVVIHDVDEYQQVPYIVLEYLKGQSFSKLLAQGPQTPERSIQLVIPIVRALVCAHANQIIHRDLKPDNLFLTDTGTVKVLDFGIAKPAGTNLMSAGGSPRPNPRNSAPLTPRSLTEPGRLVGTPAYMSPEQWRAAEVDGRTDIWAVGLILYELVVGQHPLAPLSWTSLTQIAQLDQPMPSARTAGVSMPDPLATLIDHCLAKRTRDRLASARLLLNALEPLLPDHADHNLAPTRHPYAGLASFQERDAHRFFGRDHDIRAVVTQLYDQPLIALIGPSGIGKSSFARAGIMPALKRAGGAWETHVIRPGRDPMHALAELLAPLVTDEFDTPAHDGDRRPVLCRRLRKEPGYLGTVLRARARTRTKSGPSQILLFIDQFEELYTLTADSDERRAFTSCLLGMADDPTSPLRLVIAMRSDFLDRAAENRPFISALRDGVYFLTAPRRDGLREALARPAEMSGYRFESTRMLEGMLDSLETSTNPLPLLQFTAAKLWEARDCAHKLLTEAAYHALGGIDGALASHADAVLIALSPPDRTIARTLFLHLVTPERTRALTSTAELRQLASPPEAAQRVLDHLIQARLVVAHDSGKTTNNHPSHREETDCGASVEIVHESLIHSWPTLSHWIDEGQEDIAFLGQLRTVAKLWARRGRPRGLLWRGDAMLEAQRWRRRYRSELPSLQRDYLDAVFALATRMQRRRRLLLTGTIGFLSLLVVAAAIALIAISTAEQEARAAEEQARAAERQIRDQLNVIQDKERARLAALEQASAAEREVDVAEAKVEKSRGQLAASNEQLRIALAEAREAERLATEASERAKRESARALEESARAREAAQEARSANELRKALAREQEWRRIQQARLKELEERVGHLVDEL
ncbi:MAG: serine/threonine-protein kinase [Haliangiales bacterium]